MTIQGLHLVAKTPPLQLPLSHRNESETAEAELNSSPQAARQWQSAGGPTAERLPSINMSGVDGIDEGFYSRQL